MGTSVSVGGRPAGGVLKGYSSGTHHGAESLLEAFDLDCGRLKLGRVLATGGHRLLGLGEQLLATLIEAAEQLLTVHLRRRAGGDEEAMRRR